MALPNTSFLSLFEFNEATAASAWRNVDDVVMGGISDSHFSVNDAGYGVFAGEVSLENNGGFASVRAIIKPINLSDYQGVKLRVRGDGKTYSFRLRDTQTYRGASWRQQFKTVPNEWTEIELPFEQFAAVWRGQRLPNHPPLQLTNVEQFGFLIADKQEGEFRLEIDWIRAYH